MTPQQMIYALGTWIRTVALLRGTAKNLLSAVGANESSDGARNKMCAERKVRPHCGRLEKVVNCGSARSQRLKLAPKQREPAAPAGDFFPKR